MSDRDHKPAAINEEWYAKPTTAPIVSIIIPCYNAERWISLCVQSALNQTYSNIEVIVVDDGSSDRSLDVLKSLGRSIRWVSGPNNGPCAARNIGMRLARGEWIHFLNADDVFHPQKIELSILASHRFPEVDFVWAPHTLIFETPPVPTAYNSYSQSDINIHLSTSTLKAQYAPAGALFKRTLLERVGPWNESLRRWVDLELIASGTVIPPNVIKIDIEGYEYEALRGLALHLENEILKAVIFESAPELLEDVSDFLKSAGFVLASIQAAGQAAARNYVALRH